MSRLWSRGAIESSSDDVKPFHDILMAENIVFLEVLQNLEQLERDVFFMSYTPLPIKGLDSCPVRVMGLKGWPSFREDMTENMCNGRSITLRAFPCSRRVKFYYTGLTA